MWPPGWEWWYRMLHSPPPTSQKKDHQQVHEDFQKEVACFERSHKELTISAQEARHSARNVRQLLHAFAKRVEKINATQRHNP